MLETPLKFIEKSSKKRKSSKQENPFAPKIHEYSPLGKMYEILAI